MSSAGSNSRTIARRSLSLIVPIGLVGAVLALVAPISPAWLDLLLAANLTAAVLILLQTVQVRRPLDFSVFPALLLGTTLVRLVLNVASTRLILTEAPGAGAAAAGGVIAAFGEFVAAGSPYVGGVVFAILVAIQFLVITKGAARISEVSARFSLDGMPGRQSSVDADLATGLITPEEARKLRQEIVQQADFYGAMDGASRFVRGDALAGLLITFVNLAGGLAIGVLHDGLSVTDAVAIYTTLTIGDGLVSQMPALLISIAAGLLVTRSSAPSDLSDDAVRQLAAHPLPLMIAAGFLSLLALAGFPLLPTLALAGLCGVAAWWVGSHPASEIEGGDSSALASAPAGQSSAQVAPTPASPPGRSLEQHLHVEPLELDLGVSLVRLADRTTGGDLLDRVTQLRERIAADLGFILPKVRIQDDLRLDPREYRIKLRGVPENSGAVYADALLAIDDGFVAGELTGIEGVEPATGRTGFWIDPADGERARDLGYRLLPPQMVILQQLERTVRQRAGDLLTREHVHDLLTYLRQRTPHLVDDLVPGRLKAGDVHRILCELLAEDVPVRDLESLLESLGHTLAQQSAAPFADVVEAARMALRRSITQRYADGRGVLHLVVCEVDNPEQLQRDLNLISTFQAERARWEQVVPWLGRLSDSLERLAAHGHPRVLVCRSDCRRLLRDLLRQAGLRASVFGHRELPVELQVKVHTEVHARPEGIDASPEDNPVRNSQAAQLTETAA